MIFGPERDRKKVERRKKMKTGAGAVTIFADEIGKLLERRVSILRRKCSNNGLSIIPQKKTGAIFFSLGEW